jgi:ubiquinone/menaquinone biosynthesis C-methylase UbiE
VVHPPDAENRAQRAIQFLYARSVLDVGSGTGRVLTYLKTHAPAVARAGVEPVEALRQVA